MPRFNDPPKKKSRPKAGDAPKKKSVCGSKERSPKNSEGRGESSLREASRGLDPRQTIDDWIAFAKSENYPLVAGKRRFDSDLERVDTFGEEEQSLFQFCRAKNLGLSEALRELIKGPPTREGYEHRVFYHRENDPPRVTKVTFPGKYGRIEHTPFLYLERLALSNALFPALDVRFEDCLRANRNQFSIVSSMRAFLGAHPKLGEIDLFLKERGFSKLTETSLTIDYTHRELGIHLRDCHPKNWIKSRDGSLIPIDIIPERVV